MPLTSVPVRPACSPANQEQNQDSLDPVNGGPEIIIEQPATTGPMNRLAELLQAERVAIMMEMERRHRALLLEMGLQPISGLQAEHALDAQHAHHGHHRTSGHHGHHAHHVEKAPQSIDTDEPQVSPSSDSIERQETGASTPSGTSGAPSSPRGRKTMMVMSPKGLRAGMTDRELMLLDLEKATGFTYAFLRLRNFMFGHVLEIILSILIVMNAFTVAVDVQYRSFDTEHDLHMQGVWPNEASKGKDSWPGAKTLLTVLEVFFGIVFTMEVVLKCGFDPKRFATSAWNLFDTVIVLFWILSLVEALGELVNPMLLRLLRVARLVRLLRLVKTVQIFDVLHLLVGSLKSCVLVFFWSCMLLLVIIVFGAVLLNFMVEDYIRDESNPALGRKEVFVRFGSFSRAMVTMFEMTLGNWLPPLRVLQENVDEWYSLPCLVYLCVVNFAVVSVIRAVFMSETFKTAATDEEMLITQKNRQIRKHVASMNRFFSEADSSGDGFLTYDEFMSITQDKRVKTWLAAMEFDASNAKLVFDLLDDGDKRLSAEEVVHGVAKFKGAARSIDLMAVQHRCDQIEHACQRIEDHLFMKIDSFGSLSLDTSAVKPGVMDIPGNDSPGSSCKEGSSKEIDLLSSICEVGSSKEGSFNETVCYTI